MLTDDQKTKLAQDLPKGAVKHREQAGQSLSYVDGHYAITRANDVFGHDGWSHEVRSIAEVYRGTRPGKEGDNVVMVYEAHVAVTALGVTREDVGIGQCDAGPRALAQGIEKGRKEAVTDGLKRALRTFGPSFGLALYDKSQADVGASFACQEASAALQGVTDRASLDAATALAGRVWPDLSDKETESVTALMESVTKRIEKTEARSRPKAEQSPAADGPSLAGAGIEAKGDMSGAIADAKLQAAAARRKADEKAAPAEPPAVDPLADVLDQVKRAESVAAVAGVWRAVREDVAKLPKADGERAWKAHTDRVTEFRVAKEKAASTLKAEVKRLDAPAATPAAAQAVAS